MSNPVDFNKLKDAVLKNNPDADVNFLKKALDFAYDVHKNQKRDEGAPYILHPFSVALYLAEKMQIGDVEMLASALLHDVIEDGPQVNEQLLTSEFGDKVAGYVSLLSKNKVPGIDKSEIRRLYHEKLKTAPIEVLRIKMADRLDNIRYLHKNPYKDKIKRYVEETRKVYLPVAKDFFPTIAGEMGAILGTYDNEGNWGKNCFF